MPLFHFKGRDGNGNSVSGNRVATSSDSLGAELVKEGLFPTEIIALDKSSKSAFQGFFDEKVTLTDLGVFSRQMYSLTRTGVPLSSSLKNLAEGIKNKSLSNAIFGMVEQIEAGKDIASSMEAYPAIFPPIFISIVRVGQSSGKIAEAFLSVNQFLELEDNSVRNVKSALRYPSFVVMGMIASIVVINIFVIPVFSKMYAQSKIPLPGPTQVLINMSAFFTHYWPHMLVGVIGLVYFVRKYIHSTEGRLKLDKLLLRLPIIGKLLKGIMIQRFAQTFAMTTESGIPVIEGMRLVAKSVGNEYAKVRIDLMRENIERGNNLSQAASASELFNPLELQMISVSEQTGELGLMLGQIADFYKKETEYNLKKLNESIEPIIMIFMAALVLMLALAVYLPMWNMVKMAK